MRAGVLFVSPPQRQAHNVSTSSAALVIAMFYRVNDMGFRRTVLGVLLFSGLALAF
jgi:hypothetical protein